MGADTRSCANSGGDWAEHLSWAVPYLGWRSRGVEYLRWAGRVTALTVVYERTSGGADTF